jgi:predicted alpha/beta-hydrolase family hydrolase
MAKTSALMIKLEDGRAISAVRHGPKSGAAWTVIYAPGAGSNIDDAFGVCLCETLAAQGATAVRFQFPYQEAGKSAPDRPPVLEAAWRAVIDAVRPAKGKLCIGGRSMGGRVASMVHAAGVKCDALALYAYPLHAPGKPDQPRTEHLPSIRARTLLVSGTNDAFGAPDELAAAAKLVKRSKLHLLDGADHGYAVPKRTGRTKTDVYAEAVSITAKWLGLG